jgi:16S rRNA (cytosine967-C5)-methyltransferase
VELKAEIVVSDALDYAPAKQFDAILLDAPCSATGTIRRHPDLPYAKATLRLGTLLDLQKNLLARAANWLRPGGEMVYCTCSLLPEEGEAQVAAFLAAHPGFSRVTATADWVDPVWRGSDGGLRLRPDFWAERGGMDGFYIAKLRHKSRA